MLLEDLIKAQTRTYNLLTVDLCQQPRPELNSLVGRIVSAIEAAGRGGDIPSGVKQSTISLKTVPLLKHASLEFGPQGGPLPHLPNGSEVMMMDSMGLMLREDRVICLTWQVDQQGENMLSSYERALPGDGFLAERVMVTPLLELDSSADANTLMASLLSIHLRVKVGFTSTDLRVMTWKSVGTAEFTMDPKETRIPYNIAGTTLFIAQGTQSKFDQAIKHLFEEKCFCPSCWDQLGQEKRTPSEKLETLITKFQLPRANVFDDEMNMDFGINRTSVKPDLSKVRPTPSGQLIQRDPRYPNGYLQLSLDSAAHEVLRPDVSRVFNESMGQGSKGPGYEVQFSDHGIFGNTLHYKKTQDKTRPNPTISDNFVRNSGNSFSLTDLPPVNQGPNLSLAENNVSFAAHKPEAVFNVSHMLPTSPMQQYMENSVKQGTMTEPQPRTGGARMEVPVQLLRHPRGAQRAGPGANQTAPPYLSMPDVLQGTQPLHSQDMNQSQVQPGSKQIPQQTEVTQDRSTSESAMLRAVGEALDLQDLRYFTAFDIMNRYGSLDDITDAYNVLRKGKEIENFMVERARSLLKAEQYKRILLGKCTAELIKRKRKPIYVEPRDGDAVPIFYQPEENATTSEVNRAVDKFLYPQLREPEIFDSDDDVDGEDLFVTALEDPDAAQKTTKQKQIEEITSELQRIKIADKPRPVIHPDLPAGHYGFDDDIAEQLNALASRCPAQDHNDNASGAFEESITASSTPGKNPPTQRGGKHLTFRADVETEGHRWRQPNDFQTRKRRVETMQQLSVSDIVTHNIKPEREYQESGKDDPGSFVARPNLHTGRPPTRDSAVKQLREFITREVESAGYDVIPGATDKGKFVNREGTAPVEDSNGDYFHSVIEDTRKTQKRKNSKLEVETFEQLHKESRDKTVLDQAEVLGTTITGVPQSTQRILPSVVELDADHTASEAEGISLADSVTTLDSRALHSLEGNYNETEGAPSEDIYLNGDGEDTLRPLQSNKK